MLLRADFNVLFGDGRIEDLYRIKKTVPTIELLKNAGAKTIILSHLSPGKGKTIKPVCEYLNEKYFKNEPVKFIEHSDIASVKQKIADMEDGQVVLLENLRLHEGEEKNDDVFARELASLGDIFVNDAFSVAHRRHASVVGLPKYLPSFVGLLFEGELSGFDSAFHPDHPFLLILGGIKAETKIGVVDKFLNIADKIFIGGALANNFFKAKGEDIDGSSYNEKVSVEKYLGNAKIILPEDVRKKDGVILDVGPKSAERLEGLIKEARFILWNGPLGSMEEPSFEEGTKIIAMAIANSGARTIVGGGDTVAILNELKIMDKFSFVSTAGGAMLEFLAHGTLPGIEALFKSGI